MIESEWNGRALEEDLARTLQSDSCMVWTQLPLGSVMWNSPGIVDVCAIPRSFARKSVRIYEVKVSRDDYLSDVAMGKYQRYLKHCTQLYFAMPKGLVKKGEIPPECGLISRSEKGWRVRKSAPYREIEWDINFLLKLLMKGYEDHLARERMLKRETYEDRRDIENIARGRGHELAVRLADSERCIAEAEMLRQEIEKAMDRPVQDVATGIWWLKEDVQKLLRRRKYAKEAVNLAEITMRLFEGRVGMVRYTATDLRRIADRLEKDESLSSCLSL